MSKPQGSSGNSPKSSAVQIAEMIGILAVNYPLQPMDAGQKRMWLLTYCHDLASFSVEEIKTACERYRQNADNKFMATSGALLQLIPKPTRARHSVMRPTPSGEPQPWGGACQCERCRTKVHSEEGFHVAPAADYRRDEYEREQAKLWLDAKLPSKLDEAEMRLRNELINRLVMDEGMDREEARVKIMVARTRVLYPSAPKISPETFMAREPR